MPEPKPQTTFVLSDPLTEELAVAIEETGESLEPLLRDQEDEPLGSAPIGGARGAVRKDRRDSEDLYREALRRRLASEFGERVQDALAVVGYRAGAIGKTRVSIDAVGEFAKALRESIPMKNKSAKKILPSIIAELRAFGARNPVSGAWGELVVKKTKLSVSASRPSVGESRAEVEVVGGLASRRKR